MPLLIDFLKRWDIVVTADGTDALDPRQVAYVPFVPLEIATAWLLTLCPRIRALCPGLFIHDFTMDLGE